MQPHSSRLQKRQGMHNAQINYEIIKLLGRINADQAAPPVIRWNGTVHVRRRGWDGVHGRELLRLIRDHVFGGSYCASGSDRLWEHVDVAVRILKGSLLDRDGNPLKDLTRYVRRAAGQECARNATAFAVEMTRSQVSACQAASIPLRHNSGEVDDETFLDASLVAPVPGDANHVAMLDAKAAGSHPDSAKVFARRTAGLAALLAVFADVGLSPEQSDDLLTLMLCELEVKPKYARALLAQRDAAPAGPAAVDAADGAVNAARGTAAETISGKHELGQAFGFNRTQWSAAVSLTIGSWTGQLGIASITNASEVWQEPRFVRARDKLMK
jgi:hypothetical protein